MNAAAEKRSISFEKHEMTALRNSADKMRDARMMQRLAASDPHNRRAAGSDFADFFVRNGMAGVGMEDLRGVHELDGGNSAREAGE